MKRNLTEKAIATYQMPEETKELPAGIKWTKQRKAVYQVLCDAKEPLNAAKIYSQVVAKHPGEEYAMSTIYRILAAFEEQGFVEKEAAIEDGTIYYSLSKGEHTHYAICLECHRRIALQSCPFAHIHLDSNAGDFTITNHKLELYGYCNDCKQAGRAD